MNSWILNLLDREKRSRETGNDYLDKLDEYFYDAPLGTPQNPIPVYYDSSIGKNFSFYELTFDINLVICNRIFNWLVSVSISKTFLLEDEPEDMTVGTNIQREEINMNNDDYSSGYRPGCNIKLFCNITTERIKPGSCQFT